MMDPVFEQAFREAMSNEYVYAVGFLLDLIFLGAAGKVFSKVTGKSE